MYIFILLYILCLLHLLLFHPLSVRLINYIICWVIPNPRVCVVFKSMTCFRLWITTEVHPTFPITLLQMSIKYTCEPPSGMSKNAFYNLS